MSDILTGDRRMRDIVQLAKTVAPSKATILIQGESGTGKELVAHLIHTQSTRASRPFVAINCAAIPDNLLESELFGYERGSFTGAMNAKTGKFEMANGGTLLLDEISEMDIRLQAKLLRVLQEAEVDRIGGRRPIPVDVRIIATTNRNLGDCVKEGTFREDLFCS
ncbi:MAG: sigma-54 factor interaction domain-containing protein [Bdellovibrio sp.]|nr:sigma-54 factor interaction domain-containing protein [Bdellovibrio sp.]